MLLCAHMDTVPLDGPVEVVSENGLLTNRHEAILGADNKAAVATIMGAARRIMRQGKPAAGVEILFTTGEEQALKGAKAFDQSRLSSDFGYVFDHASAIGEIVLASPTYYSVIARFKGKAAHAGIRPEAGHNAIAAASRAIAAMQIGRIDPETTANVGRIEGGTAANVVAERCFVELETRSLDDARAGENVSAMVDAHRGGGQRLRVRRGDLRGAALPGLPATPHRTRGRGGRRGAARLRHRAGLHHHRRRQRRERVHPGRAYRVVNLANGTERNHQPDESVTVEALETMLDVTIAIVAQAGRG